MKRSQIQDLRPRSAVGVWASVCMLQASVGYAQFTALTQTIPPVVVMLEGGQS